MSVLGGCDCLGGDGIFVGEKFFESDRFVAAWACAAVADSGHENAAVFAALGAEETGVAVGALVHGAGTAWRLCWDRRGGYCRGVAGSVRGLPAGVGAPLAGTAGGERPVTGRTFPFRYGYVTR